MSWVVSVAGGVPVGAPTCGTSPAFAETVGRAPFDPPVDVADEDVEEVSGEFI
jgi:hypothetical protein